MVAYHTSNPKILYGIIKNFDTQIEIDKHLLKKIFQPVGKKKYIISFVLDKYKSFKMKSVDEQTNEILSIIVFNQKD
jgi:hypothetical protein